MRRRSHGFHKRTRRSSTYTLGAVPEGNALGMFRTPGPCQDAINKLREALDSLEKGVGAQSDKLARHKMIVAKIREAGGMTMSELRPLLKDYKATRRWLTMQVNAGFLIVSIAEGEERYAVTPHAVKSYRL